MERGSAEHELRGCIVLNAWAEKQKAIRGALHLILFLLVLCCSERQGWNDELPSRCLAGDIVVLTLYVVQAAHQAFSMQAQSSSLQPASVWCSKTSLGQFPASRWKWFMHVSFSMRDILELFKKHFAALSLLDGNI